MALSTPPHPEISPLRFAPVEMTAGGGFSLNGNDFTPVEMTVEGAFRAPFCPFPCPDHYFHQLRAPNCSFPCPGWVQGAGRVVFGAGYRLFGAGVFFGGRPAPLIFILGLLVAQVPLLKLHLHHKLPDLRQTRPNLHQNYPTCTKKMVTCAGDSDVMFFPWFLGLGYVPGGKRNVSGETR